MDTYERPLRCAFCVEGYVKATTGIHRCAINPIADCAKNEREAFRNPPARSWAQACERGNLHKLQ